MIDYDDDPEIISRWCAGSTRIASMDRAEFVRRLSRLTPTDLAALIASIPGAARQVSRQGAVPEQVGQLIAWAESTTGPGLRAIETAYQEQFAGDASPTVSRPRNLPFTTIGTLFKGRDDFLAEIRAILTRNDGRAVAVHGLGGVGKTRVALEYAWKHESEYTGLLFVSASSGAEFRANLASLVNVLAIAPGSTAVDEQVSAVLRWLEAHPGWLLVIDNVDSEEAAGEVRKLLVRLRAGHVLITTRISNWPAGVALRELSELAEADAIAFLLERTGRRRLKADDADRCAEVARELGYLALALEHAGAYIDKLRLTFSEYLVRWRQKRLEVLRWYDARLIEYPASVAVTWETTFAQLSEPEQRLLKVLAWLAPEPIPLFFLDALPLIKAIPEPREALAGLAAFSLARFETVADAVVIHRLVQEVARGRVDETGKARSLRTALAAINSAATGDPQDVRSWTFWTPLAPHVASVVSHADEENIAESTSRLMNDLGLYCLARGQFREAEPLLHRVLAIDEHSLGTEHPRVAKDLNDLALLLNATNRFTEAEPLMRRALAIDEQAYGTDHPSVATMLSNLAELLLATNRLAEAEPLMRRALAIDERSYGQDHPKVALGLNNLAQWLSGTNRLAEAEPLMRRALAIDEQSLGRDHPSVARDLGNLAMLLKATGRLSEADPLMRRALSIAEQSYGTDHPDVARALNNLAALLQSTNRLAEAEPLLCRALAIDEHSYGQHHPRLAIRLNNLAALLQDTNRLEEAEPLYRRALSIDEQSYGQHHPEVATDLSNLAWLLTTTNRLAEAEPLMRRALTILLLFAKTTGYEHPNTRVVGGKYCALLLSMGMSQGQVEEKVREVLA
jgi:tetratricopeptide (TPR) repeat protein